MVGKNNEAKYSKAMVGKNEAKYIKWMVGKRMKEDTVKVWL